jgi:hypothetical protein
LLSVRLMFSCFHVSYTLFPPQSPNSTSLRTPKQSSDTSNPILSAHSWGSHPADTEWQRPSWWGAHNLLLQGLLAGCRVSTPPPPPKAQRVTPVWRHSSVIDGAWQVTLLRTTGILLVR